MWTRNFFALALLSVLLAITCHILALRYAGRSGQLFRQSLQHPDEAQRLRVERTGVSNHTYAALWSGVALASVSVILTILSYRAEESAPRSIPIVLLLFYGLLHFVAV